MKKESKKQVEKEYNVDVLDILLDEENDEPVTLYDENDHAITFEQVAVIPLQEKLYIILKPVDKMEGVADDEAIVFRVEEEDGETELVIEEDEKTAVGVFDEFYRLIDEENDAK